MKKTSILLTVVISAVSILTNASFEDKGYKVGDKASDFNLKNVDGKMVSMKSYKNAKGFIIIFTCNTCPYAVANENRIIALHKKYESKGFPVIAINPNDKGKQPGDSFDKMQKRAKEKSFPFAYVYDESQEVASAYGATKTPHVYLLDKDMMVKYIGAIDDSPKEESGVSKKYLEEAIDALLAGKEVPNKSTVAIGCTIKWK